MRPFSVRGLFLAGLFLLACAQREAPSDFTLRISAPGPLEPLEPRVKTSFTMVVKGLVFELLVEPDAEGRLRSRVLRSWAPAGPGEHRLELIRPLRFSDGSEVRDEDLAASLEAVGLMARLEPGAVYARSAPGQASAEAQLRTAVLFRGAGASAVGTGPFRVVSQSERSVRLRRREPAPGRISAVELIGSGTAENAFARALRGEANALVLPSSTQLELLEDVDRFQILRAPGLHALMVVFNARRLSREEQRALAARMSPRDLARAYGPGCDPYPEPPAADGRALPRRALRILATNMANGRRVALAVGRALEPGSAAIDLVTAEDDPRLQAGEFDLFVNLVQVWPPSIAALNWRTGAKTNSGGYSNPAVDAALQAGDDEAAGRALEADPPALKICRHQLGAAIDSRVRNPRLGPYGVLQSLADWEVGP